MYRMVNNHAVWFRTRLFGGKAGFGGFACRWVIKARLKGAVYLADLAARMPAHGAGGAWGVIGLYATTSVANSNVS